jgi:hypothetical protein
VARRLLAIAHVLSGMSRKEAAEAAGMDRQTLIGQKGRVCHIWWKRGERPLGLCDKRFTFAYIFAAVEPGTDNAFALMMPYADTAAMQSFLDRFSETLAEDEHAVMVLDQAGWHGANALAVPANVTLVPLPAH